MDPKLSIHPLQNQPPPPSPSSDTSFPILAISILGILTTAILLVSYYVFVIKCCLNWHRSDVIRRLSSTRSRRRRQDQFMVYMTATESRGLDESTIRAIPIFRFRKGSDDDGEKRFFNECAVCLNEFQDEEKLRFLPNCSHAFHIDCIDTWLQTNANCPLCRSEITRTSSIPNDQIMIQTPYQDPHQSESVVIDVRDDGSDQTPRSEAASTQHNPSPRKAEQRLVNKKLRKFHHVSSMGDECIDVRGKDEQFSIQPIRRSFSMDSSCDRQLYISVQEILQQNPNFQEVVNGEEGSSSSSSSSSARIRRSFFSFGHGRCSRNAVLPIQMEL